MNIQCLLEYKDELWYGTDQGLYRLSLDRGVSQREANFPVDSIKCLLSSTSAKPWCGTVGGLVVWEQDWREVPLADRLGSNIRCLLYDDTAIWCGTNTGLGKYTGEGWETFGIRTKDGLPSTRINCLLLDSHGNLWCGTERGLARFDGKTFQVTLANANVTCLLQDTSDTLWCGTTSGLYYCEGDSHWNAVSLLAGAVVQALLKRNGDLWCATAEELYLSNDSGWRSAGQMQLKCLLQDRQDRIWCGGDGFDEPLCIRLIADVYQMVRLEDLSTANSITEVSVEVDSVGSRPPSVQKEHKRENMRSTPSVLEPQTPASKQQPLSQSHMADILPPLHRWRRLPIFLLLLIAALGWFLSRYSPPAPGPVAVVERFYQSLSGEGRLDPDLTTPRLRSQIGSNTNLIMNRGNLQDLSVKVEQIDREQGEVKLDLLLQDRLPLDTSITLRRGETGWQVDRVRYYSQRRCRSGRNVSYLASDTNAFQAGQLIAGILRAPCY